MADNRIRFSIDSVFNGEGFNRATNAVKGTSDVVKRAADGVRNLSDSFGQMGGAVSKVSDGIGKLMGVFLAGGPFAIATAALSLIVTKFVAWRNELEETRKKHEELIKNIREGYERRVASYYQKAREAALAALQVSIDKGQEAIDKINALATAYRNLGAAEDAAGKSANAVKMAEIDLGLAFDGGIGGEDAKKRAAIQARIDKELLAYEDSLKAAQRAQFNAAENVNNLTEKYKLLQGVIANMREAGQDTTKKEGELRNVGIELAAARQNLTAATNGVQVVELKHKATVMNLENEQVALEESIQAREEAERIAAQKTAMKTEAEERARKQIDEVTEKSKKELAAIDRKIAAQDAYIEAIKAAKDRANRGMDADAQHTNGLFGPYDYQRGDDGSITDFEDFRRSQRFAGRADRDRANTENRNRRLDAEAERLRNKKNRTDSENKRLKDLEEFKKQRADLAAEEAKRKRMEEDRAKYLKNVNDNVQTIKDNLKKALEVQ